VLRGTMLFDISIPSGAIKRFPFSAYPPSPYNISIPSGAIKSRIFYKARVLTSIFQFLLVRLRECDVNSEEFAHTIFQFLLVRLRVASAMVLVDSNRNFNSFWCD